MDYIPTSSFLYGIFQAKTLEWVAISFSRGSSWPRDRSQVSCIGRWVFCSCFLPLVPPGKGFPWSSVGKESACSAGDLGSILGLGRSPGEENGNPLQCLCLENPMDRGAWATVHEAAKSRTRLTWLNMHRGGQGAICSAGGVYEGIYCIVLWVNICYSLFQILDPSPKLCHLSKYLLSKKHSFLKK